MTIQRNGRQNPETVETWTEIFRFTANSPLPVPSAPGVGEDTVARYVGGGGGGCALQLLCFESLGEVTFSPPPSLGWLGSVTLDCPSWDTGGGGRGSVPGPLAGGVNAGGVLALGAGGAGAVVGDSIEGGEEVGGVMDSLGGVEAGGVLSVGGFWSSGVWGPEGTGGAAGFSEGGGEDGRGGRASSFGGGDVGRGGPGCSAESGDVGKGGAGDSGGGGDVGSGGGAAGSCVCSRSADSSLKQTHVSSLSSPAGGASSGPKMLSKSAIEGFLLEPSASADASEIQTVNEQSKGETQQTGREGSRCSFKLRSLFSIFLTTFAFWGHREGTQMGEGSVHQWVGCQFIAKHYVNICGFGTLLKGTSAVLRGLNQ